jgi:hypothetical protein
MIDVYIELFNIIFETGIIPDSWLNLSTKIREINLTQKISDLLRFIHLLHGHHRALYYFSIF